MGRSNTACYFCRIFKMSSKLLPFVSGTRTITNMVPVMEPTAKMKKVTSIPKESIRMGRHWNWFFKFQLTLM